MYQRRIQQPVEGGSRDRFERSDKKKIGGHFLNLGHFGTYLAKFTPVTGPECLSPIQPCILMYLLRADINFDSEWLINQLECQKRKQ